MARNTFAYTSIFLNLSFIKRTDNSRKLQTVMESIKIKQGINKQIKGPGGNCLVQKGRIVLKINYKKKKDK